MVFFLTAVLIVSSVLMVLLLYAKHWEISHGELLFPSLRPRLSFFFEGIVEFFEYHAPTFIKNLWLQLLRFVRGSAREALAHGIFAIEQALERALYFLRHGIVPPQEAEGEASAFLREVTEYKKRLNRRPLKRRMIEEE